MLHRLKSLAASLRNALGRGAGRSLDALPAATRSLRRALLPLLLVTAVTAAGPLTGASSSEGTNTWSEPITPVTTWKKMIGLRIGSVILKKE